MTGDLCTLTLRKLRVLSVLLPSGSLCYTLCFFIPEGELYTKKCNSQHQPTCNNDQEKGGERGQERAALHRKVSASLRFRRDWQSAGVKHLVMDVRIFHCLIPKISVIVAFTTYHPSHTIYSIV